MLVLTTKSGSRAEWDGSKWSSSDKPLEDFLTVAQETWRTDITKTFLGEGDEHRFQSCRNLLLSEVPWLVVSAVVVY